MVKSVNYEVPLCEIFAILLGPNIPLSTLLSVTLNLRLFLRVKESGKLFGDRNMQAKLFSKHVLSLKEI
jgi:hypothetical protein